jgi:hypothetical protein
MGYSWDMELFMESFDGMRPGIIDVAGKARTKLEVLRGTSALNGGIFHFRV